MSLAGELNITHVLRGKITSLGAINAPDKTLSVDGASADAKATGDALAKKADKAENGTVISENADFAEIGWWMDGNPNNEDRTGYFVCIADEVHGTGMRKAKSVDDVRGVVVTKPAFAGNATEDKFDENGQLLPKYDFVGIMGLVSVIDDGSCIVNERCMPNDEGIATASNNNLGYHVIERVDRNHVLIAIEPNGDMVQRIKTEIEGLSSDIEEKVDKVSGKGLSTNDFTNAYKTKLDGVKNAFTDEDKAKLDSIEAGANKYELGDGDVTTSKLANEGVTRAKLAKDALYGPVKQLNISTQANYVFEASDIGKTLMYRWVSGEADIDTLLTMTDEVSGTFPVGTVIAVYWEHGKSCSVKCSGSRVFFENENEGRMSNSTLKIQNKYGTVALKLMLRDGNGRDYWNVVGIVEVV